VRRAAESGLRALHDGASVLEAAVHAVSILEDDPLFNAGRGASLTADGTVELDAAVMEGATGRAGAVGALPPFSNPIRIARAILEDARHFFYAGEGAARFAEAAGFERLSEDALITEAARERLAARLAGRAGEGWAGGTVGAVVSDGGAHVAAATSTGGTVGKMPGRIGDTPLIGAGTYADDRSCAVSATGVGEMIIRSALASRVFLAMETGDSLAGAVDAAMQAFAEVDGSGGLIAVSPMGEYVIRNNTETMSYAVAREGDEVIAGI
jgi:beta-aspartyl-peptidase (threonine type)